VWQRDLLSRLQAELPEHLVLQSKLQRLFHAPRESVRPVDAASNFVVDLLSARGRPSLASHGPSSRRPRGRSWTRFARRIAATRASPAAADGR
jgi:hypothetical protein